MTHRAKLRRLAFIACPLPATRRHRGLIPGHESWQLHVPYSAQCRRRAPACQGKGNPGQGAYSPIAFRKAAVAGFAACPTSAPRGRALDDKPVAAQRDQRAGQGAPQRERCDVPQRLVKRPRACRARPAPRRRHARRRGREAAAPLPRAGRANCAAAQTRSGRASRHGPGASAALAAATANSIVASARRMRRRQPRQAARIEALARQNAASTPAAAAG